MNFSVVIPCHNAERTVAASLGSAVKQSLYPYEIIVINDNSTDNSVKEIEQTGIEVRLLHTKNLGGAGARNEGIRSARGDWLAFLDADDLWYPNHLERAAELIRQYRVRAYINHYDHLDRDGEPSRKGRSKVDSLVVGQGTERFVDLYARLGHFVGMSACIVERQAALEVGGLDEQQKLRHDIEFWLRLTQGRKWLFDPVATSAYRADNPRGLSLNKASAELYRLTAFLKNKEILMESRNFLPLVRHLAYRTMARSYVYGTSDDQFRANALAYCHLCLRHRMIFWLMRPFPRVLAFIVKRTNI